MLNKGSVSVFAAGVLALGAGVAFLGGGVSAEQAGQVAGVEASQPAEWGWTYFTTAEQLAARLGEPNLLVLDARSPEAYAQGHIPGAVNLPGEDLRTPSAKPGQGDSQYIFRKPDGSPDVAKYVQIFSEIGVSPETHVVVYGNHAGQTDGSIPAMILHWLGHEQVSFLDGVGVEAWKNAGFELSAEPVSPSPAQFRAEPIEGFVWNLDDVLANLQNPNVAFYDTRSLGEYTGQDKRNNAHGGHIPGAVRIDYAEQIQGQGKTLSEKDAIVQRLKAEGITPDRTIVLYCQTSTRVSLPYLILKDLGYPDVVVYDASWHEYGNLPGTPKATGDDPVVAGR